MARPIIALDANASVPTVPEARAAAVAALDETAGANPSSPHGPGRRARRVLDRARDDVAAMCGASPKEIFFTSGATEGNRFVVDLFVEAARVAGRPWRVVTSPLEHTSLHKPLQRAHGRGLLDVRYLPVVDGTLASHSDSVAVMLADADAFVVTAAHNETGLVTDVEALLRLCPPHVVVAVDAAQSMARRGAPPARADIVVVSAHKLGGVAGAGAMVLRGRARPLPLPWTAGGQEQGVRPGTENIVGIAALGAAAAVITRTRGEHRALASTRDRLEALIVGAGVSARVLGVGRDRLENTSALFIPDVDGDAMRLGLDQAGVAVGFGAACSALAPEPSPSLQALGLAAADTRRVVRLSLAPGISDADVDEAATRIVEVLRSLRRPD